MKLTEAEIVNYRSIKKEKITFDPSCRILVGINESGKSNILKALALLSDEYKPLSKDDVRESLREENEVEESYVKFFFRLNKSESDQVYLKASNKVLSQTKDPEIVTMDGKAISLKAFCGIRNEIRYLVDVIKEEKVFKYVAFEEDCAFNGLWKKCSPSCPAEYEVKHKGQSYKLADYTLIRSEDFPDIPSEYLEDVKIEALLSLIGSLAIEIGKQNTIKALFWKYDESNLLPSQIAVDEFAADPNVCVPLKNMFALSGITDVKTELERVKKLSNNQFQNFLDRVTQKTTDHFRSVWKEYKTIEFVLRLDGDKIIPAIKEQNSFDFSKRSDGFKRFVTFLLMISVNVKTDHLNNALLLIDEPDSGLHPSGARYLRDELIKISSKNYVAYSTHSIFMIDSGNIGRHYVVKKKNEITSIESAKDSNIADEEVLFNALGFSVFEILKDRNIIFEGWKDKKLFKTYIDASSAAIKSSFKDTGICHAKGAKHMKAITPMMELGNRHCLIISDSDAPAKEQQKQYRQDKGYGEWKTYQDIASTLVAVTGEDFVKNEYIVKQVNSAISGFGLPVFKIVDLSVDKEKLKAIESWLRTNNLSDQQAKDVVGSVKELIFDNLVARDIGDDYQVLIKGIIEHQTKEV